MPILSPAQTLLIGMIVAPGIYCFSAYLTRARFRRGLSGLAGGLCFGILNMSVDALAKAAGWWTYPAYSDSGNLPITIYIFSGMVYGAFSLIGWRITRRYSRRGFLIFLLVWSLWGMIHDLGGSYLFANSNLMTFGPGYIPILADFLLYLIGMMFVIGIIRWIGGPFHTDALRQPQRK